MKKQLLVCLDDSAASSQALTYIGRLFRQKEDVDLILLHCYSGGQTAYPEPEDERNSLTPTKTASDTIHKGDLLLSKARQRLELHGIAPNRIAAHCQSGSGVAKAIMQFASRQLVDAVVIARRGVGVVGELLLGSVSSTLFDKCRTTPLWVIDGEVSSQKFLVPVDGTPYSLMAIDHLAHIFAGRSDVLFHLFHVRRFLSPIPVCRPEKFYDRWGKTWCDTHLSGDKCMFTGPSDLLRDAGIPDSAIITLPEPTALEESTAIMSAARKYDCGTIVFGRRPEAEAQFFFGGVCKRTIMQAENLALWVIG